MDIKLSNSSAQFDGLKYEGKVPCFKVSIELAIALNSRCIHFERLICGEIDLIPYCLILFSYIGL